MKYTIEKKSTFKRLKTSETEDTSSLTRIGINEMEIELKKTGKKAYIKIKLPNTTENEGYLSRNAKKILAWGNKIVTKDGIEIVIEGYQSLSRIILELQQILQNKKLYEIDKKLMEELKILKTEIRMSLFSNPDKSLFPHKVIDKQRLELIPFKEEKESQSKSDYIFKTTVHNASAFYKEDPISQRITKIIEIEPFFAACFQLMMGQDCAPEMGSVYENRKRKGVWSKEIPGFISMHEYYKDSSNKPFTQDELIDAGVVPAMVSTFIFADIDAHFRNWGLNQNKQISRCDFDLAGFKKTCKMKGFGPHEVMVDENQNKFASAETVFKITKENILNFPDIKEGIPYNWITVTPNEQLNKAFEGIKTNPKFIYQKWKYFLKAILIDSSQIKRYAENFIGSPSVQKEYADYVNERIKELREVLVDLAPFKEFIENNKNVINELLTEFKNYNSRVTDIDFLVDLDKVSEQFEALQREMAVKIKM